MPGASRTRSPVCSERRAHERCHCGHAGSPAFPAAMVLRFPSCSPRRPGLLSPSPARRESIITGLISASGDQAHTTSPSACRITRQLTRPTSIASRAQRSWRSRNAPFRWRGTGELL